MDIIQLQCKKLKEKFYKPINSFCLICFNKIDPLMKLLNINICFDCLTKMKPSIKKIQLDDLFGIGIYPYQDTIKDLLYQFKGCYDIALKDAFINHYAFLFRIIFFNYVIVFVPSYEEKNKIRGFNHVEEMFKCLKIKTCKCLIKTKDVKQSSKNKVSRLEIKQYFSLNNNAYTLKDKNILLVDDVLTTGSTLLACYELLKTIKPKKIKFLVMSYSCRKTLNFDDEKNKHT